MMVASRSDTKRRRRDSSPLDSNPKRTKVHAQRKFAQGVSSLGNQLPATPGKGKSDKLRKNGLSGNAANGLKGSAKAEKVKDGATTAKRALPARGAKKPSIEDMITFLCYRGTAALPPHLAHLNKAPSPEPHLQAAQGTSETSRGKLGDKGNRDTDKANNKKSLKSAASTAQKAVTAAQALKRKYHEQRIKKSTVSTLTNKVKGSPLLRTTRSTANCIANIPARSVSKKAMKKSDASSPSKKKDSSIKDELAPKKSSKLLSNKLPSGNKITTPPASGSRGGLRSSRQPPENALRSGIRKLGSAVTLKKKKISSNSERRESQQSKKLATSLSDFSSEDDQPLVKKHKPLVQVQKLIKKSIANIGRKMKMEPRRSKRGLSSSPVSPSSPTAKRTLGAHTLLKSPSHPINSSNSKDESKSKSGGRKNAAPSAKELGSPHKSVSDNQKKEVITSPKSTSAKMKKGYVMELVRDSLEESDPPLETRSRRGSRDVRDISDDKILLSQSLSETTKGSMGESKKKETSKSVDQSKKLVGSNSSPKSFNLKHSPAVKGSADHSLSAVLKNPPDLRIPPSIKRPLTVGITNPMAIAAAAAVVCKTPVRSEEKGRTKDSAESKDHIKKTDMKRKEIPTSQAKSNLKPVKVEEKTATGTGKSIQGTGTPEVQKNQKPERSKSSNSSKVKAEDFSDEDCKPIISMASKDKKKGKDKIETTDSIKDVIDEDSKPQRSSRRSGVRGLPDDDDANVSNIQAEKSSILSKKSSDEDELKLTARGRRSTNRSLKKEHSSDDDEPDGQEPKGLVKEQKKISSSENDSQLDPNTKSEKQIRQSSSKGKVYSSDEDSSEHDDSDASLSATKPSTRSAVKSSSAKVTTRSVRPKTKAPISRPVVKNNQKQAILIHDGTSDEGRNAHEAPKTRSKVVSTAFKKSVVQTESSDDGSETDMPQRASRSGRGRQTTVKREVLRSSSSESVSSFQDDKSIKHISTSKKKNSASELNSEGLLKKSARKLPASDNSSKNRQVPENEDRKKTINQENKKVDKMKREEDSQIKETESPRRSSRKSAKSRPSDDKYESSVSEGSSSESSPSQNRRVLRERRGFFSFAEVDPPSDSEEEVLAATKASLEMIRHQPASNPPPKAESQKEDEVQSCDLSQESDTSFSKKEKDLKPVKVGKKEKADHSQPKKSISKKRVKVPSEVQSNLNDELEKTLLSINLSPEMSKSFDKSPDRFGLCDDAPSILKPVTSISAASTTLSTLSSVSPTESSSPVAQKQRKIMPKTSNVLSSYPSQEKAVSSSVSAPQSTPSSGGLSLGNLEPKLMSPHSSSVGFSVTSSPLHQNLPPTLKMLRPPYLTSGPPVRATCTSTPLGPVQRSTWKSPAASCNVISSAAGHGTSTSTSFSAMSTMPSIVGTVPPASISSAPLHAVSSSASMSAHMQTVMPTQMTSVPIPSASVSAPLTASLGMPMSTPLPVSMSIPLTTQLGIPMQTSGGVPLSVPMSGAMTLPLQVSSLTSGTPSGTPFLLPVQSTLGPMLASGQAIIKKEAGNLGGMPNPVGNTPLMMGMNPLVVNSNRGAFILSTGSTMTMTSTQQQIMPGPLMPSLVSVRLPDKPAGQQTIMANPPLYMPFFGNAGIIQGQSQVQPQIQTMTGVSTITAMATNIQNTVTTNLQNTAAASIQSPGTCNMQNVAASNIQNVVSSGIPVSVSGQNTPSISSALTLAQNQAAGVGTGMKRQLVLATKNGPVSKLILSVGEDGSHVLAAANPSSISMSDGQTLMSAIQPVQPVQLSKSTGPVFNLAASQSMQTRPASLIRPPLTTVSQVSLKGLQPASSVVTATTITKQPIVSFSSGLINSTLVTTNSTLTGSLCLTSSMSSVKNQVSSMPIPVSCPPASTTIQSGKSGLAITPTTPPIFKGTSGATVSYTSSTSLTSAAIVTSGSKTTALPSSPACSFANPLSCPKTTVGNPLNVSANSPRVALNTVANSNPVTSLPNSGLKIDSRPTPAASNNVSVSTLASSLSSTRVQGQWHAASNLSVASMTKGVSTASSFPVGPSRPGASNPKLPTSVSVSANTTPLTNAVTTGSPDKYVVKSGDTISTATSLTPPMVSIVSSRIPSAPAALAALKSPSGANASTRAIAKTGSSRKPYSTAASYAAVRATDSGAAGEVKSAPSTPSAPSAPSPTQESSSRIMSPVKTLHSQLPQTITVAAKAAADPKPSSSLVRGTPTKSCVSTVGSLSDSKCKGSEVELAPTHRTLSMLSTAFHGSIMIKDRKRETVNKKAGSTVDASGSSEKQIDKVNLGKSGLDSLAEVATSLAERSVEASDKRVPEHSLWANPAQILGQETIRVPGLPITANVGTNLPTKNELAKMKSGAVLADAKETRTSADIDKVSKGKGNLTMPESEKPSVSGLLASTKADTPRQKVQKWLDNRAKGDVEHKGNCSLLSRGSSCTCDVVEDISNLNSLAEVCISMERINSPSKDVKPKAGSKLPVEKKKKQELVNVHQSTSEISGPSAKSSLPLDSHQMKVTWQNAFGVKSPIKPTKAAVASQLKQPVVAEDLKTKLACASEVGEKGRKVTTEKSDQSPPKTPQSKPTGKKQGEKQERSPANLADQPTHQKKSAQRRSILGKATDSAHLKLGKAFSAENESSVYAFQAETDAPPVSQPFRRRSKTLSRSDEEDSTSMGSISNPVAVHVSKDPVFVPIQMEADDNSRSAQEDKNGVRSATSPSDNSDVYYIPLCGQDGNEGDVRAVAVRLGKEGPNNRVVMSAKLVKKPPMFKHPSDTNEDGLPNKSIKTSSSSSSRAKMDSSSALHSTDLEAPHSSNQSRLDLKMQRAAQERSKASQKESSRSSTVDSLSEETASLLHVPLSSKDSRECRNSMSPASSRNRSPISDKASPSTSQKKKKANERLKRQSSMDSDSSDKVKSSFRGSKSKSASSSRASPSPSLPSTSSTSSGPSRPSQKSKRSYNGPVPGNVSEAPVFHPTEKEFQDPYAYIEKIRPVAEKYGLCRIVAPHSFKPDCSVEDDIRFTADNQYVHKMMDRWGPNAKEMRAIVKYIAQHNIHLKHAPLVGGIELDLPRLYTTVQNFGGLMEVMDKKRWVKVAETMRIPKSAQDRASKLDEVYCKCLLPYETLKTSERDNLFEMVEVEWEMRKERRDKRLAASADSPDHPELETQQDDEDEDDEEEEDDEEDECIVKGRSMPLTTFYRTARNTTHMWFKGSSPSASEVEHEFWRHVKDRNFHICVNSGSVDCSDPPYGFPIRNSPFAKHPWNLKVFSNSNGSVLRSLGSVIGVTVPTLHFGMVFTTCCWYRDPHGLPWIEYLHTGAKKIWYGIPEHGAEKFRSAMQEVAPHYVRKKELWLASDTAMIPPHMLTERKVPLCRTVQEPGQFIVVFPKAHTSSVATGYIVSESVSFAPPSWLSSALESFKEMQKCNEPPLFSLDKLIFSIAEDSRSSLHVLNTILPSTMEILEREITYQQELKKKGVKSSERIERKKAGGKKAKSNKESEDSEVMECDVCSTNLYLSMVLNNEDDSGYCLVHASSNIQQGKLNPSHCKLLYTYTQNELHEFCQNLLDRIEAKSSKKGNFSSNNSDSGSSASTSTRH